MKKLLLIGAILVTGALSFADSKADYEKAKTLAASTQYVASDEILEEDENGIPLEHKDFILDLSRKINKKIAKRWDEHFNF